MQLRRRDYAVTVMARERIRRRVIFGPAARLGISCQ
jgi:hypothetical protein